MENLITVKAYWQNTFVAEMTGFEFEATQFAYEMLNEYGCTSLRMTYHSPDYFIPLNYEDCQ